MCSFKLCRQAHIISWDELRSFRPSSISFVVAQFRNEVSTVILRLRLYLLTNELNDLLLSDRGYCWKWSGFVCSISQNLVSNYFLLWIFSSVILLNLWEWHFSAKRFGSVQFSHNFFIAGHLFSWLLSGSDFVFMDFPLSWEWLMPALTAFFFLYASVVCSNFSFSNITCSNFSFSARTLIFFDNVSNLKMSCNMAWRGK